MNYFFWTKYPFVQVGLAFIGGIALAYTFTELPEYTLSIIYYRMLLGYTAIMASLCLIALFCYYKKRISVSGAFILLAFASLGFTRFFTHDARNTSFIDALPMTDHAILYGEVVEEPVIKKHYRHFLIKARQIRINNNWKPCAALVKVTLVDTSTSIQFKDQVLLTGNIEKPSKPETPYDFNYARFLANQNIHHTLYVKTKPVILTDTSVLILSLKYYAIKIRQQLEKLLAQKITHQKAYALVTGLLVGKRSDFEETDKQLFTTSGTIHVLAVSGMHVVLIYQSICFLASLCRIRLNGFAFNLVVLALIWFYIFITGLQASAVRAAIMITLVLLAKIIQREDQNINSLMATACLMLLYNPYYLSDAGFILSFLAVVGIILSSSLSMQENKNKITTYLFNASLISIAAQAATFPYSIHLFHQFPVYFLLANLIIVPLTTLLLFLSVILLFVYTIPYLNELLVWLIELFTDSLFYILQLIGSLPFPIISRISLSTSEMLLLYMALSMGILLFVQRNIQWLWGITLSIFILCGSLHCRMIWQFHHPSVLISGKKLQRQYLISSGRDALLITYNKQGTLSSASELFLTDHFIDRYQQVKIEAPHNFVLRQRAIEIGVLVNKPYKSLSKSDFFKNCKALLLDYTSKSSYLDPNNKQPDERIFLLNGKKSFYSTLDL